MLRILDKNKNPICLFDEYSDLLISRKLEMDEKVLSFTTSIENVNDYIMLEGYIETKDDRYVVKEINKSSKGSTKVVTQVDVESLEGKNFISFETLTKTVAETLALAFAGTGWTVGTCDVTKRRTIRLSKCSRYEILKSVVDTFMVEIVLRTREQIVDVYENRGSDRGVYFTDELNLKGISVTSTSYDYYTELEAYGKDGLTFASINDGKNYVVNHTYSNKSKRFIWKDERYTNKESLLEDSIAKLRDMATPYTSYEVEIIDLAKASNKYKALDFKIGDTVTIIDSVTKTKVKQRIVAIEEHPEDPLRNTCTISNLALTFDQMTEKYNRASAFVDEVSSDGMTINGSSIENAKSIHGFDDAVENSTKDLYAPKSDFDTLVSAAATIQELKATLITAGEIVANMGTFDQLTAQNFVAAVALIHDLSVDDLTARTAMIEYLHAEDLEANNAYITNLKAQVADVDELISAAAYIKDLYAETITTEKLTATVADVGLLNSDVANIMHLLSGNIGTGSLSTITLNAQNAVIDSAFFKNLVSQNISVADLLAGNISTTKFTVGSDSGNFKIEDNTLTIKDNGGNTRVQIGEDNSGNYSIIVYDASGSGQLFNENGITESGISDGLIKNAKIADNAAIHASKLDINSLFTEINNSTDQTIKASRIWFDEEEQSLSALFSEMHSSINGIVDGNLLYQFTYVNDGTETTLTAHVYRLLNDGSGKHEEITDEFSEDCFWWSKKSEDFKNDTEFARGKVAVIANSDLGLSGNVDGWFYPFVESVSRRLTTRKGKYLTTREGSYFTTRAFIE